MEKLVTFYEQQGGFIDFTVKRGYYAGASYYENDRTEVMYVPNGTLVGREADDYITIDPMESVCDSQPYTENHNACTSVDVYRKKDVNAGCLPGWSAALVEHKMYGHTYVSMKVKQILFTRPFKMKEVAKFFREKLTIKEAKELYRQEMRVVNIRPMRVLKVLEAYETVPEGQTTNQSLTIEEALYVSRNYHGLVYCQQPFQFFGGEDRYPVFYLGELICTGEHRQNDSFKIALLPQEKVAFEWSSDDHRVALLQITEEQINVTDDEAGEVVNEQAEEIKENFHRSQYSHWAMPYGALSEDAFWRVFSEIK